MPAGTVKWFNPDKGYGFIRPSDGGDDVFVHISALQKAGFETLPDGQPVTYELIEDRRGRMSAGNLALDGELIEAPERPPRRDFGDRPPRRDFGDRGGPRRDFGDRPPRRDFGDRPPPRRDFDDRGGPRRDFGDRPPRRDFGDRPPPRRDFDDRGGPRRDFGDRPPRRDFGDRGGPRRDFGDRPPRRDFDDQQPRGDFDEQRNLGAGFDEAAGGAEPPGFAPEGFEEPRRNRKRDKSRDTERQERWEDDEE